MSFTQEKAKEFLNSLKLNPECPTQIEDLHNAGIRYLDAVKKSDVADWILQMQLARIYYTLITTPNELSMSELRQKFHVFQERYREAKALSLEQNKKLLIALGETHDTNESFFMEVIIASFLKQEGITRLLTELDDLDLQTLREGYSEMVTLVSTSFCQNVLNMDVFAVDPEHNFESTKAFLIGDGDSLDISRNNAMNKAIAETGNRGGDVLAIVGESHLRHIVPAEEIQDKFIVLPVYVGYDEQRFVKSVYGDNFLLRYLPDFELGDDVVNMRLSRPVESFSINKLIEIAFSVLNPSNDNLVCEDTVQSDFSANPSMCEDADMLFKLSNAILVAESSLSSKDRY